jgi:hypothetical protein
MVKRKNKIKISDIKVPKFELSCDKKPTDYQLADFLIVIEDIEEQIDNVEEPDVKTDDDEIEKEVSLKEKLKVDKNHPDGTQKTKQEIADELYNKRKEAFSEEKEKMLDLVSKSDQSLTTLFIKIEEITQFLQTVTDIQTYVSIMMDCLNKWKNELINSPYVRYIELKIQKFLLKIKRLVIIVKQKIKEIEKKILFAFYNGKCVAALETLYAAMIVAIVAIKESIDKIIGAINKIISFLPDMIKVGAEAMSFFMTPKSMQSVPMPIVNLRKSVVDVLDEGLRIAINEVLTQGDKAKAVSKGAYIASRIASTQVSGIVSSSALPNVSIPEPGELIRKSIDLIINLIPLAKPLPKFENLNIITNPGYLIFLMTGWCRAGQCAFGMPGQLIGVKPLPMECSESI